MYHQLEIIGFNLDSCRLAQSAGAHRIELCGGPGEGGTTPSFGFIAAARQVLQIELCPIIRPRGGDFVYSAEEYRIMQQDIRQCRELGCEGVVAGLLLADGQVDYDRTARLVELAYPMELCFHRAFDRSADPFEALEQIIRAGCVRLLTSGQEADALTGAERIARLIGQADGRITVMPGGGVRSSNLEELALRTGATAFHSSARITVPDAMTFRNMRLPEPEGNLRVDAAEIAHMLRILRELESRNTGDQPVSEG